MNALRYVIVTPVRNEENNLPRTIASCLAQTIQPAAWIIVDDGSTDDTGQIADTASAQHDWIQTIHRPDRGFRQPGTGVMEAFHAGLALVRDQAWDFLVKLDGDLAFESDYFEKCFERFDRDPRLGIGGGVICRRAGQDFGGGERGRSTVSCPGRHQDLSKSLLGTDWRAHSHARLGHD